MSSYRIQAGDTLSALALRFGTTVDALARANKVANPNLIFTGNGLQVPDGFDSSATGRGVSVGGDSFSGSADSSGIADAQLSGNLAGYSAGDWGGQCCAFVEKVFGLEGKNQEFGLDAVGNGGVTVNGLVNNYGFKPSGAVPGAVFQGNWEGGAGPGHTGIVLQNLGNGKLLVEDSNWAFDEKVSVHQIDAASCTAFCVKP